MTEAEKEAEGIRIIQEYLADRRAQEQIPGTREYELEQMLRPVREKVAAMSPEERYKSQKRIAQIREEMPEANQSIALPPRSPRLGFLKRLHTPKLCPFIPGPVSHPKKPGHGLSELM